MRGIVKGLNAGLRADRSPIDYKDICNSVEDKAENHAQRQSESAPNQGFPGGSLDDALGDRKADAHQGDQQAVSSTRCPSRCALLGPSIKPGSAIPQPASGPTARPILSKTMPVAGCCLSHGQGGSILHRVDVAIALSRPGLERLAGCARPRRPIAPVRNWQPPPIPRG